MISEKRVNIDKYCGTVEVSDMAKNLQYKGVLKTSQKYRYWCSSVIKDDDGVYHLFATRWTGKYEDWYLNSEIVQFTSNSPDKDFELKRVVLGKGNMPAEWQNSAHNGHIYKIDGKYVLIYITFDTRDVKHILNNQMIGMITTDNLSGEWSCLHEEGIALRSPLDTTHWAYNTRSGVNNPTLCKSDGKYKILFKGGGPTIHDSGYGEAVSDTLDGHYTITNSKITDNIGYIEDACNFEVGNEHYLLTTDNFGINTGLFGAGILWKEIDGVYTLANAKIGFGRLFDYIKTPFYKKSANTVKYSKLERPFVLVESGVPTYLYTCSPTKLKGTGATSIFVFKINKF